MSKEIEENLECGPSLAEEEHRLEFAAEQRRTTAAAAAAASAENNEEETKPSQGGVEEALKRLRAEIASDVVTSKEAGDSSDVNRWNEDGRRKTTLFMSPWEMPVNANAKANRRVKLPLVYADQTASNRPLQSIEDYLQRECLPLYGNTHTNTSITGSQSTAFCSEARQLVAEATNAKITGKASLDVVLFAGNGATSAVELLIDCLGLRYLTKEKDDDPSRPIVFVGPQEHHSNLIPWRESGCQVVCIPESDGGGVDLVALQMQLQRYQSRDCVKMGTFAAASNVTGRISDVDAIAALLHSYGALAFFDYATAAPYMPIDMNPLSSTTSLPSSFSSLSAAASSASKDAVFISPHKMLGGVSTPGVLIVKKHLVDRRGPPNRSGGGTVFYVTPTHHRFLSNRVERYEGGTPNIMGVARIGLAFLAKRSIESRVRTMLTTNNTDAPTTNTTATVCKSLLDLECRTYRQSVDRLKKSAPNLLVLGEGSIGGAGNLEKGQHLPILSFLIKAGERFLHYNYVCAVLNDVFGIQSRGGCQCAGPYSQRLLGLTTTTVEGEEVPNIYNQRIEHALVHSKERAELLRPGYSRLSLPFKGLCQEEVDYILTALEWVSKHAWALMAQYRCNHRTGEWRHHSRQGKPLGRTERKWLSHYSMATKKKSMALVEKEDVDAKDQLDLGARLKESLETADTILEMARTDMRYISQALNMNDDILGNDDELEELRWYVYPKECAKLLAHAGHTTMPGTESNVLFGAVRPVGYFKPDPAQQQHQQKGRSDSITQVDRKRTKETVVTSTVGGGGVPVSDGPSMDQNTNTASFGSTADPMVIPQSNGLFSFREGEHTGEASIEDIECGYDDGELTEACEVLDDGEWMAIEKFLATQKKMKVDDDFKPLSTLQQHEPVPSISLEVERLDEEKKESAEEAMSYEIVDPSRNAMDISSSYSSKTSNNVDEAKKPARDSSSWGKASSTHVPSLVSSTHQKAKGRDTDLSEGKTSSEDVHQEDFPDVDMNQNKTEDIHFPSVPETKKSRRQKKKGILKPPPKLMRYITQAMLQWNMLEEGDRLLLGLSGGKDSLSLLHCLLEFQRKLPINFTIEVCTIDPMTPSFDPSPLIPYVESLGLKYHYIRDDIVERANTSGADGKVVSSLCAFCARMKRGNLYGCARKNNCNKLVLAQHLDDCAESFMMSTMHNGFIRTMKAHYQINAGDISVIRPMVYCRESLMTEFAKSANLPVINENCPACFEEPKERARIKKLLSREETLYPSLYDNMRRSLIPLMHDDSTSIMRSYLEEALAKSRKNDPKNQPKKSKKGKAQMAITNGSSSAESNLATGRDQKPPASVAKDNNEASIVLPTATTKSAFGVPTDATLARVNLRDATEEELVAELARRRAERFRLAGAMKQWGAADDEDPTGQVCSLNGGNGTIPCRELME